LLKSANAPWAVLLSPIVLLRSAPVPTAVFSAAVLSNSVAEPTPVLKLASELLRSESKPIAVLCMPVVILKRAFCPSAVLLTGLGPGSGVSGGLTACIFGEKTKQVNENMTRSVGTGVFMARSFARIELPCRDEKLLVATKYSKKRRVVSNNRRSQTAAMVFASFRVFRGQLIPTAITSRSRRKKAQLDSVAFAD
jgi:hypothetical protein